VLPSGFTLLQIVPDLETGGAEQSTLDVSRAVVRAGGRSIVASRGGRMALRLGADGGELVTLPVHSKNPATVLANAARLAGLVRREGVSLLHVRSRAPAFSTLLAARMTGRPWLATYHGAYPGRSAAKRWYNSIMTRGDLVIANSHFTREHLTAQHQVAPEKVVTIPRGADFGRFDPAAIAPERIERLLAGWGVDPADTRVKMLLAGRFTRLKGQLVMIEAAARLKAQGRDDVLLIMVGDDQGRNEYRAEAVTAMIRAGLQDSVRLGGHCDDMPAAYAAADVVLIPSTVPETFGRTAVEAQAMGRPVIASALGALTETVLPGETGWLAKAGDAEAWAAALAQAVDVGPQARAAMGARGRERVLALYSVEAMTDATLAAYRRLLEARRT
jgi:glycosyltransferase involved in cell wall biosynthesis